MQGADKQTIDRRNVLRYTGAAAGTSTLLALAGCVGGDDDNGDDDDDDDNGDDPDLEFPDDLTITLSQFPDVIDPLDHITGDYFDVFDHIYEPLFDFEPGEGIFPRVATDWEIQEGEGETHVTLRDDVMFHNGDNMMAEDVAWTINRTVDDDMGPVSDIGAFGLGSITGAEAVDDYVVSIQYGAAPGLAEFEFGNYARAMNMNWAIDNYDADETGEVVAGADPEDFNGTGPLEVVDFTSGEEIVCEPFDDYWGDPLPFDSVTFNADGQDSGRVTSIETGETDLTINIPPEDAGTINDTDHAEIRNITSFRTIFLPMKNTVEPFDSQEFRQAMNYAVDNAGIVETILSGFGAASGQPVAPGINGYNENVDPYPHDPELAEQLVEDSGYAGAEIELTYPQGRYLRDADIGEAVADQIDQLDNVSCSGNGVEFPVVSDANSAGVDPDDIEHPFYMIGWGTITGDTDYGVQGFFSQEASGRTFDDAELSDAVHASQAIEDPDERREQLEALNEMAHEKAPWVFLHVQESIYGVNSAINWEPREDETIYVWGMSE